MLLGPVFSGQGSRITLIKAINGFGVMAFFYRNLYRLADGLEAKRKMPLLPAFIKHQMSETKMAKALAGPRRIARFVAP